MKGLLILLGVVAAAGIAVALSSKPSVEEMKVFLISRNGGQMDPWNRMTDQEIRDVYTLLTEHMREDYLIKEVPADLKARIQAISKKYNIFT